MRIISKAGREDIAIVYVAEDEQGRLIEFVQSLDPPKPAEEKWVNIISTMYGCPVKCKFCDANDAYLGKVSADDMIAQIEYLVDQRWGSRDFSTRKWKIQFARMGEPALNRDVLKVLRTLPQRFNTSTLIPSISTIAPASAANFFEELLKLKQELYPENFQMQFSLHTTDLEQRKDLIPVKTWSFDQIAEYGNRFYNGSGRKITLNFALADIYEVDPDKLLQYFSPESFLLKLTPLNPTYSAVENNLSSMYEQTELWDSTVKSLRDKGYDLLESVGVFEENEIGSNCGQYISSIRKEKCEIEQAYSYPIQQQ